VIVPVPLAVPLLAEPATTRVDPVTEPQGPARRRYAARLSAPVPVRFPPELLERLRQAADADDRSLSSWIRLAVEHELRRTA
jgi:predicted HicB family RNase H-like nuclease